MRDTGKDSFHDIIPDGDVTLVFYGPPPREIVPDTTGGGEASGTGNGSSSVDSESLLSSGRV